MSRRPLALAGLLGLLTLAPSGCWDYRDLEDRAVVMGIAVDYDPILPNGPYLVTVEMANPAAVVDGGGGGVSGGGGGASQQRQRPKILLRGTGDSVADALNDVVPKEERTPLWKQTLVVIVSEDLARAGVASVIDLSELYSWLRRARRGTSWLSGLASNPLRPWRPEGGRPDEARSSCGRPHQGTGAEGDRPVAKGSEGRLPAAGLTLERSHPDLWRRIDWGKMFPEVPVSVRVKARIRDSGEILRTVPFK